MHNVHVPNKYPIILAVISIHTMILSVSNQYPIILAVISIHAMILSVSNKYPIILAVISIHAMILSVSNKYPIILAVISIHAMILSASNKYQLSWQLSRYMQWYQTSINYLGSYLDTSNDIKQVSYEKCVINGVVHGDSSEGYVAVFGVVVVVVFVVVVDVGAFVVIAVVIFYFRAKGQRTGALYRTQ